MPISPSGQRWEAVERLYHAACERPAAERTTFLESSCPDDGVRLEVESLLAFDTAAVSFLEEPAVRFTRAAGDDDPIPQGTRFGSYEIGARLGSGGMGEVYRARDTRLGRDIALKVLRRARASDPAFVRRLEDEARAASVLNHPNIVTIYGVGEEGDVAFIAMELVHGSTLRQMLAAGAVPAGRVLELAVQLADALAAAHARGIVHRDLKPENVMVTLEGVLKILDFGIATQEPDPSRLPAPGPVDAGTLLVGTIGYMSPEQARRTPADHRADQFAFGVIIHELLSGRRLLTIDNPALALTSLASAAPVPIELDPRTPLYPVVARCLAKDPRDRYDRTDELAEAVRGIRDAIARRTHHRRFSRRQALILGASAATAVGAVWYAWPAAADVRSVAILPFANPAGDPALDYLCEGFSEGLIQRLSRIPDLAVRSRASGAAIQRAGVDLANAASVLRVDAIVTGAVTRRAGKLRVDATLTRAGTVRWTRSVETDESQLLLAQQDLAVGLVDEALGRRVTGAERRRFMQPLTTDAVAHDLYLQALFFHRTGTEDGYAEARDLLHRVVDRDPGFARAFAALASTYTAAAVDGYLRPNEAWPNTIRYVGRALRLDPDLPDAHAERASVSFFFTWDWEDAEHEWNTAVRAGAAEINPDLYIAYAVNRWVNGDVDDALRLVGLAETTAPLTPGYMCKRGDFLAAARRFDDAAAAYAEALKVAPDDVRALSGLADTRRRQNRLGEATAALRRAQGLDDAGHEPIDSASEYAKLDRAAAVAELKAVDERAASGAYVSPFDFARGWARLGDFDRAFAYFDAAFVERAPDLVFLNVDRVWEPVRTDPRLVQAATRVGLT